MISLYVFFSAVFCAAIAVPLAILAAIEFMTFRRGWVMDYWQKVLDFVWR